MKKFGQCQLYFSKSLPSRTWTPHILKQEEQMSTHSLKIAVVITLIVHHHIYQPTSSLSFLVKSIARVKKQTLYYKEKKICEHSARRANIKSFLFGFINFFFLQPIIKRRNSVFFSTLRAEYNTMEIDLFSIFNFLTFQRGGNLTMTITKSNQFSAENNFFLSG